MTTTNEAKPASAFAVPLTAFVLGAVVSLLLGVFGKVHNPTLTGTTSLGYPTVIDLKVVVTAVVGVLAVLQVIGALWLYGKLGLPAPRWLGPAHRAGGVVTLLLSMFVAYNCLWALGLESGKDVSTRVVVHGVAGCAVYGVVVVKIFAVRSRRAPGWFLPLAGGLLFALFMLVVFTSTVWYVGHEGWPSR